MEQQAQELVLIDPTSELHREARERLPRPASLRGLTVAIMDIAKPPGEVFLERLAELFSERGVQVKRYTKPHFSWEAPTALKQTIAAECSVVVEGLAD